MQTGTKLISVIGGGGFLGRYVVQNLARQGARVRVCVRDPEGAKFLKTLGTPGQVNTVYANVCDPASLDAALAGSDAVINLAGIIKPFFKNTFERVHVEGAANVATATRKLGIDTLVHVSSLSANADSKSEYARTKFAGEQKLLEIFPGAVVLRPSLLIGVEDQFMNLFAKLARYSPVLPVVGCPVVPKIKMVEGAATQWRIPVLEFCSMGGASFQPIFVGDVADAVTVALDKPDARSKIFELVGPTTYTFKRLLEMILAETGQNRLILPLPIPLAMIYAFFLEWVPGKPATRDQVRLIVEGNTKGGEHPGIEALGIEAQGIEAILPTYLRSYREPKNRRLREA